VVFTCVLAIVIIFIFNFFMDQIRDRWSLIEIILITMLFSCVFFGITVIFLQVIMQQTEITKVILTDLQPTEWTPSISFDGQAYLCKNDEGHYLLFNLEDVEINPKIQRPQIIKISIISQRKIDPNGRFVPLWVCSLEKKVKTTYTLQVPPPKF